MTDALLTLKDVTKSFDGHYAVDGISMEIPRGKIFGLLGPNGAGKTTLIRMITRIIMPDEGQITFDGEALKDHHANRIGYMPEERGLYPKMKVLDQIQYLLTLKGMSPKDAKKAGLIWLNRLGLAEWAGHQIADLSKGMKQKVQFISTVAHEPDLLILDEPFSGLDPVNAQLIEQQILNLVADGTTIIFSTHRMEQVEELCQYIGLVNQGKLVLQSEINSLRKQFRNNTFSLEYEGEAEALNAVSGAQFELEPGKSIATIRLEEGVGYKSILGQLIDLPIEILKFEQHSPKLQDIFIQSVGAISHAKRESTQAATTPTSLNS
ncbi:ATP-binding cassette domain-containing protein [Pontibacter sp. G13]|uniref:ABC transporter ATP-binding protein n=1 Tax=Pontibacter sp. G13 TaxID=3074898 RepID=UPI00288A4DEA|nr:ATP-binding cassette domain-containing protein [Pontibacter sp. G13]WNJ16323.1 ATP-binding cassette domain-containing protein [Pontibacter sp. G13]